MESHAEELGVESNSHKGIGGLGPRGNARGRVVSDAPPFSLMLDVASFGIRRGLPYLTKRPR